MRLLLTALALLLLVIPSTLGFSPKGSGVRTIRTRTTNPSSALNYVTERPIIDIATPVPKEALLQPAVRPATIKTKRSKPSIREIRSLDDLHYFLEEDSRPVAIKFHAPWCKTCQRLGMHFAKLAMQWGDTIVDRQMVEGSIRFASIEYGSETSRLITEVLQIQGVPTLQLYSGVHKLWDQNGATTSQGLKEELLNLSGMSTEDIADLAEGLDDHILENAIEERFFDGPDFLNEEW